MAAIRLTEAELLLTHDVLTWNRPGGTVEVRRIDGVCGLYDIEVDADGNETFTNWYSEEEE
jgi:hypothetical protein